MKESEIPVSEIFEELLFMLPPTSSFTKYLEGYFLVKGN